MEALSLEEAPEDVEMKEAAAEEEEMTVTEEGAFTLTVGGAKPEASKAPEDDEEPEEEDVSFEPYLMKPLPPFQPLLLLLFSLAPQDLV